MCFSSEGRFSDRDILLWTTSVAAIREHPYCLCNTSDVTDEITSTVSFCQNTVG